jgi:transposase
MTRRKFTSEFKTKVVLEALKERKPTKELAARFKIHPQQISNWKREFLGSAKQVFESGRKNGKSEEEQERDQLLRTIGELKVENDFLKKRLK